MCNSALASSLLLLLVAAEVRAETVDATITTMVAGRQDPRDGSSTRRCR